MSDFKLVKLLDALQINIDNTGLVSKYDATTGPTANSDASNTDGNGAFSVGSHWVDVTGDAAYVCVDATATAAVWKNVSAAGTGLTDPMTTRGDIIIRNAANATARLGVGTSGQALVSDGTDISWGAAGTSSPLTTKGDLYTYDSSEARLPIGTDGFVLSADSAEVTGLKWITAPSGVTDHTLLSNIGTNTHAQIDTHIALTNAHLDWTQASVGTIHATNYVDNDTTDHTAFSNIGTNTHAQIDTHIALTNAHLDWTQASVGTIHATNYVDNDTTDHTLLSNIGTNTHAQIDTAITNSTNHIADGTIHFTESSIDASAINASAFLVNHIPFSDGSNLVSEADFSYDTSTNTLNLDNLTFDTSIVGVGTIDLTHTATEADDHALEIDLKDRKSVV